MEHLDRSKQNLTVLTLAALGVVYGDIGTSPLYTVKEIFLPTGGGVPLTEANILGAISTVLWTIMLIVTLKYVVLVLRANNRGEGGVLALTALAAHTMRKHRRARYVVLLLGMLGACLFYGDAVLTPALSVLSAVEGLEIITPALKSWILPVSASILVGLFMVQKHGTASVGKWFGPIVVCWFLLLGSVGLWQIMQAPQILVALNPAYALAFLMERGAGLFFAIGAVVLAITGCEALYADMGHFGAKAVRTAWLGLVMPALALNYIGQGALLLHSPQAVGNPFYLMFPSAVLIPAVAVATLATIIASQAVISGAYSVTQQAIQMGLLPRMRIIHTSADERGQVYVPAVNWFLLVAVSLAVFGFRSSSSMAAAYGIAVTLTMVITTMLTFIVVRYRWGYPLWLASLATGVFLLIDGFLFVSTATKVMHGGWFTLLIAAAGLLLMLTWRNGRRQLQQALHDGLPDLSSFADALLQDPAVTRIPHTAVYLSAEKSVVPAALLHNLKHNHVLHERNFVVNVQYQEMPFVPQEQRLEMAQLNAAFWQVTIHFGFMDAPNIPKALLLTKQQGLELDPFTLTYFLSRETVVASTNVGMSRWRKILFDVMQRNAARAVDYFHLPNNAVVELGSRVVL